MDSNNKNIEVSGNVLGLVNAYPNSTITQHIYNTINPSELITHIKQDNINKAKQLTFEQKEKLEKKFYFIDDSYETIFNIVCNNLDIRNDGLLNKLHHTIATLSNQSYWLLGNGGEGKSTTLIRLAIESVIKNKSSFYIDFENPSLKNESINDMIKYIKDNTNEKAYIFIDNPDIRIDLIEIFFKQIIKYNFEFVIILAERKNRYNYLKNTNESAIYITNQTNLDNFLVLTISNNIKKLVYEKFYKLLGKKNKKIEEIIDSTIKED